ncbi:cation:proton antiporter [Streptomyces phaeoluteigriseus]|uniref:Cation:proton antiporter n=1 Tax=Streptomyces phaeoluteigriseus TaxID=114686 RepID=A0ABY4ZB55_9ACTN|nr:cation:proton antiporter [Streptomyces phaeoluteigriseus]USQ86259.1 cation:proton antiporter [Streptomyces phaeoluteigriseus]
MTDLQAAILLADLALIVVVAQLAGRVARALGQPPVLGEIVGGILVGPTLFNGALAETLFPHDVRPYLGALADLGLVLFMFIVGLEFDFSRLRGSGRVASVTALGATVVPFGLGCLLALHLAGTHESSDRLSFVLFIGVALSVTAFPVLARILEDRGMAGTALGAIALSAAAACDLAVWTMLSFVQAMVDGDGRGHWRVILVIPFALFLYFCVRPLLRRLLTRRGSDGALTTTSRAVLLTGLFASAAVTQLLGLHFVFGAFLFGLVVPRIEGSGYRQEVMRDTRFATGLLLPVYFIVAGLKVDLSGVGVPGLGELTLIMLVAVVGKFGGAWLAARSQGLPSRSSAVLATLMNTRGLTELVALSVGLQAGILDERLYSLMVVMAVVTTAAAGPLLAWLAPRQSTKVVSESPDNPSRAAPSHASVVPAPRDE